LAINLQELPREIRDKLEMREAMDPTFFRALEEDYTQELFETLESRKSVDVEHSYIASCSGQQGSGKSYAMLALAGYMDPNFSEDNIYFDYNKLVYDRHKLKPHSAVVVDEQTESYGLDSHRVNIILGALKEQLRKKSIHFFFCSPTLKPEAQTSMYVFETMFIDKTEKLSYAAYKTRELHCLGYVTIPHPLNFISQKVIDAYEKRKDLHLDQLTGKANVDEIEERAKSLMSHPLFKAAEKRYILMRGFIPTSMLMQVINKIYPEFKSNIVVGEIASRIKFNREMTGQWLVPGTKKTKKGD
jgi:hypothetical protein